MSGLLLASHPFEPRVRTDVALAAGVALLAGTACVPWHGAYSHEALTFVLAALLLVGFAFAAAAIRRDERVADRTMPLPILLVGLVTVTFFAFTDPSLLFYATRPWRLGRPGQGVFLCLLASYLPWLDGQRREPRWLRPVRFALFALVTAVSAAEVVWVSPSPHIDVWSMQMEGGEALWDMHNPYTAVSVPQTGPSGPRFIPYVYMPGQLLLSFPAWNVADVRYAMVAGLVLAGLCLRFLARRAEEPAPALVEDAPALLLWSTPKLLFVIEAAWTEPLTLALVVLAVSAQVARRPLLGAAIFGVALATKQQMIWFAVLAPVLLGWNRRQLLVCGAVAAAIVLPFLIADPHAFKRGVYDVQSMLPAREDGLTFNNWAKRQFGHTFGGGAGFVLAAGAAAVAAIRLPRTPAAFALASTVTYLVFSAFNKWAFCNYYFFVAGLAALWAATARLPR